MRFLKKKKMLNLKFKLFIAIFFGFSNFCVIQCHSKTLKVMTFNIRGAATKQDNTVPALVKAIKISKADIIGLQETRLLNDNNCKYSFDPAKSCPPYGVSCAQEIAKALGYYYYEQTKVNPALWANAILSKYPIVKPTQNDLGVLINFNGKNIYFFNIHLTDYPYGPAQLLKVKYGPAPVAKNARQAINWAKKARGPSLGVLFKDLCEVCDACAVFIVGDFNEPSFRDWTNDAVKNQIQPIKVCWPTTLQIEQNGFKDVLRKFYPNEIKKPAFTWPTINAIDQFLHYDRLDFIFIKSENFKINRVLVIGEKQPEADMVVNPWTSDHRAVVANICF